MVALIQLADNTASSWHMFNGNITISRNNFGNNAGVLLTGIRVVDDHGLSYGVGMIVGGEYRMSTSIIAWQPVKFIYGGKHYAGIQVMSASAVTCNVMGTFAQGYNGFPKFINYYNTNPATVLNQEVYDSIEEIVLTPDNKFNPFQDRTYYNASDYISLGMLSSYPNATYFESWFIVHKSQKEIRLSLNIINNPSTGDKGFDISQATMKAISFDRIKIKKAFGIDINSALCLASYKTVGNRSFTGNSLLTSIDVPLWLVVNDGDPYIRADFRDAYFSSGSIDGTRLKAIRLYITISQLGN